MIQHRRRAAVAWVTFFMILPGTWGTAAAGTSLYVSPAGSDSNDCLSPETSCLTIQAAIDKAVDHDTIDIAPGTYAEAIEVSQRENLTLQGAPAANIVPPLVLQQEALIFVIAARQIHLRNLTVSVNNNPAWGIQVADGSLVFIEQCTVEDGGLGGIRAFGPSSVSIRDSIVQRNTGAGIRVDAQASVQLAGSPFSNGTSIVRQNPFAGVIVNGGAFSLNGSTIVEDNSIGIMAEAGSVRTCCELGERRIVNNDTGFFIRGGHLELRGPARVEGNAAAGIQVVGGSASFGRFSSQRVVIGGNGTFGILGIGSHLDLFGIDVVSNTGMGVVLRDSSSARAQNTSVVGNGDLGIRVEGFSSVQLVSDLRLENNRGADLSCSSKAHAWGDNSGVRRMSCPGFERPGKD